MSGCKGSKWVKRLFRRPDMESGAEVLLGFFVDEDGIPVVTLLVDSRPTRFLVDTGASGIVLPGQFSYLRTTRQMTHTYANMSTETVAAVRVPTISGSGFTLTNYEATVMPQRTTGLLGQSFLRSWTSFELDYGVNAMVLRR